MSHFATLEIFSRDQKRDRLSSGTSSAICSRWNLIDLEANCSFLQLLCGMEVKVALINLSHSYLTSTFLDVFANKNLASASTGIREVVVKRGSKYPLSSNGRKNLGIGERGSHPAKDDKPDAGDEHVEGVEEAIHRVR